MLANPADAQRCRYLLLQHRQDNHWDFPKGTLDPGESDWQAAVRELREETGIVKIVSVEGFKHEILYQFQRGERLIDKTVCFFLATTDTQTIRLSQEHTHGDWFDYDQAYRQLTFDNSRHLLKLAHEALKRWLSRST